MSSPILRLHSDAWERILSFLSFESISKLLVLHPQLSLAVRNRVKSVSAPSDPAILDVGRIFRICRGLPSIKELTIDTFANIRRLEEPLLSLGSIRNLTSLRLTFRHAIAFTLPLKLSELLPELLILELRDYQRCSFKLTDFSIPPRLQVLKILPNGRDHLLDVEFVSKLPRTLTKLAVRCIWKLGEADSNGQPLTDYVWPPNLVHCSIEGTGAITMDYLPRTVTHLRLGAWNQSLATTFPQSSSDAELVFPWRQFFPLLSELHLSEGPRSSLDIHRLLETIILDTALDSEIVNRFISSGSWNIPSLRQYQSETHAPYPLFTAITAPQSLWALGGDAFSDQLDTIAPFIQRTNFRGFNGRMSLVKRFPAIEDLYVNESIIGTDPLNSSVKSLSGPPAVRLSNLPPNITYLDVGSIYGGAPKNRFLPTETLPASLTSLRSHHFFTSQELRYVFGPIATKLTTLKLCIDDPKQWKVLAQSMISLKFLDISLGSDWRCSEPLVAIASTVLENFALSLPDERDLPPNKPILSEFLHLPSIFPKSLKSLSLPDGHWHASVLAVLPRTLDELFLSELYFDGSMIPMVQPYPEAQGMSIKDLLHCLPPRLTELRISRYGDPSKNLPSIEFIKYLPQTLHVLEVGGVFDESTMNLEEIKLLLPPYLTHFESKLHQLQLHPSAFA